MTETQEIIPAVAALEPVQLQAITLLAAGKNKTEVAQAVGRDPTAIHRWLREDETFKEEYRRVVDEVYEAGKLRALNVLDTHLDSDNELTQWRAADSRLKYDAGKLRATQGNTVSHVVTIIDKVAQQLAATPAIDAEYAEIASTDLSALPAPGSS